MEAHIQSRATNAEEKRVLFAVGPDQPGVVREIAQYLAGFGANIEDSRMSALGGVLSVTMLFTCRDGSMQRIIDNLDELSHTGLEYRLFDGQGLVSDEQEGTAFSLDVECMDHQGVVKEVVRVLHEQQVHIESLETTMRRGAFCGTPVFRLKARATMPDAAHFAPLRETIETLARIEGLDITLCRLEDLESDCITRKWAC